MLWWQQLVHFLSHTVPATLGLGGVADIAADYQESVDPPQSDQTPVLEHYVSNAGAEGDDDRPKTETFSTG